VRNDQHYQSPISQRGFSLVLALFIIMICGLLATALINTNSINADSVAREVLSTRALLVAESGAQRAAREVLAGGCAAMTNAWNPAPNCAVAMLCNAVTVAPKTYSTITATGTCGPANDAAQRSIQLMVQTLP
jgi:MSHA biogenesis protein MshP